MNLQTTTSIENDKKYIENTIAMAKDLIADLDKISVYNDDYINDEVDLIKKLMEVITDKTEEEIK